MQDFPHHYAVAAAAAAEGDIELTSDRLPTLASAAPAAFGGPGDRWSPETLVVAAVADCFILTFRAIAQASKLSWTSLRCEVEGTLDQVERVIQFTAFRLEATLTVPPDANVERAERILGRTEKSCLISNSLKAEPQVSFSIETAA